ncbi:MAG: hypothetical protein IPK99_17275 [Flavobacteriales bacterium]|nr:hypothetical protein [Flavobacteriales bacterium]
MARDGRHRIELKVRNINALFNSLDPAPFREKDLDAAAEAFIVGWAEEYAAGTPLSLRIHVQEAPVEEDAPMVRDAIHNYFAYRGGIVKMELRRLLKQGRLSLLIGIAFLTSCLFVKAYLLPDPGGPVVDVLRESLVIAGWVAMWQPMQIYLYGWWPLRRRGKLYANLAAMPVSVVVAPGTAAVAK